MIAGQVVGLLAAKHAEDVFVPECKDGPSYGSGLQRLDAWAMKKSWANPCVTGYEVKVSRGDFLRDDKWRGYLQCCNEFYFVAPADVIKPEEVPPEAGLMVVAATGTRLFRKKKAPYRDVQVPESLYRYILFTRTKVTRETRVEDKRAYWAAWMEEKKVDREFGWNVARSIQKRIEEEIKKVREENKEMADRMKTYEEIRAFLTTIGVNPADKYLRTWEVKNKLDEIQEVIPRGLISSLERGVSSLSEAIRNLRSLDEKFKVPAGGQHPEERGPTGGQGAGEDVLKFGETSKRDGI